MDTAETAPSVQPTWHDVIREKDSTIIQLREDIITPSACQKINYSMSSFMESQTGTLTTRLNRN